MRRFKSILFVADGGEGEKSVLARAVRLASANSAKLTLFAALDAEGYQFNDQETRSAVEAVNEAHLEERRKELEGLRQEAISEHPQLTIDVGSGNGQHGCIGDPGGTRQSPRFRHESCRRKYREMEEVVWHW